MLDPGLCVLDVDLLRGVQTPASNCAISAARREDDSS
jgi:hypothetical protein